MKSLMIVGRHSEANPLSPMHHSLVMKTGSMRDASQSWKLCKNPPTLNSNFIMMCSERLTWQEYIPDWGIMCWPYLGLEAWTKTESVSVDVNHSETDDVDVNYLTLVDHCPSMQWCIDSFVLKLQRLKYVTHTWWHSNLNVFRCQDAR